MAELLLELGCEELPASFVRKAYQDLEVLITVRLREARISFRDSQSMGTPRRLIVQVQDVADRQPDTTEHKRGPALSAAYDASGSPTKALEGFCRSQGVELSSARKECDYVWVTKAIAGRPAVDVLTELLPEAIRALRFEKSMRWGNLRMKFARPIRWILASFDGKVVPFEVEGIQSGMESCGHRFNHGEKLMASNFDQLVKELRNRQVEPDPAERERRIRVETASAASGEPQMPDALVEENVFLTEWPTAVKGYFRPEFLELPEPVLVTAMAKHEKFFPIRDEAGKLTNSFISIRNGGVGEVVSEGNAWVMNARFNDAKFFFDEDRKHSLQDFLEKTRRIVFQDKLGTVHQRAMRLAELSREVALATGADEQESEWGRQAGLYAKADLSTGLVIELPALQGLIGGEYARAEGMPNPVCLAIACQYDLDRNPTIDCEGARTAVRLLIADQLDKLAGYLGIGEVPKGTSDPYGLRRCATLLIDAALRWPSRFDGYKELLSVAQDHYRTQGIDVSPALEQLAEVFRSRYESIFGDRRYDLVQAALLDDYAGGLEVLDPQGVRFRIEALECLADDIPFIQTATRPLNIVAAAVNKGIPFAFTDPFEHLEGLDSKEGDALAKAACQARYQVLEAKSPDAAISPLKQLEPPINFFFDSTMVMAENEKARFARLSLLHGVNLLLRRAGDFSKIVVEG